MRRSGILHIEGGEARLDQVLLARQGSTNPVGEVTKFLEVTCQVDDGDKVTVEGITDMIGRDEVIYVRNAWRIEPVGQPEPVETGILQTQTPAADGTSALRSLTSMNAKQGPAPTSTKGTKEGATKKSASKRAAAKKKAVSKVPSKKTAKRSGKKKAVKRAAPKRDGESKLRFRNSKASTSRRGKAGRRK